MKDNECKICGSNKLNIFAHTAKCQNCEVLLYYPYPKDDRILIEEGKGKEWIQANSLNWYSRSSFFNHNNFTHMLRYTIDRSNVGKKLDILDYGGGGGQFALVCNSHFPEASVYITDISDESLLSQYKALNNQIQFKDFDRNEQKFDFIFLNDVFEHVSNPVYVLNQLSGKLKEGGKIFIDTPRPFWIYPVTKLFSRSLYKKVLRGTVSMAHLQIWSKKSFNIALQKSNLNIHKYKEVSEYTQPASYYIKNMGINNPAIILLAKLFYSNSKWLARNKITCVCTKSE